MRCLNCNEQCDRDEVDVGVGIIYGPYGCGYCGWSESEEYDRSKGKSKYEQENPEWIVTPTGNAYRKSALEDKLKHFGIDPKEIF